MHKPKAFGVEMAIEKLKRQKEPSIAQIPAELIKVRVEKFVMRSINLLFLFGIRRNCARSRWSRSFYVSIGRVIKQTVVIMAAYNVCQIGIKFYTTSGCQG